MAAKSITETVTEYLEPILSELVLSLYDITFTKEGKDWFLRIFIDKEDGLVTINDCEAVSRRLETVLDEKDPIEKQYILEVSSPGIERRLKKDSDFLRFVGSPVEVRLFKPIDGKKKYTGVLLGLSNGVITIQTAESGGETLNFQKEDVSIVKTIFIM